MNRQRTNEKKIEVNSTAGSGLPAEMGDKVGIQIYDRKYAAATWHVVPSSTYGAAYQQYVKDHVLPDGEAGNEVYKK